MITSRVIVHTCSYLQSVNTNIRALPSRPLILSTIPVPPSLKSIHIYCNNLLSYKNTNTKFYNLTKKKTFYNGYLCDCCISTILIPETFDSKLSYPLVNTTKIDQDTHITGTVTY